MKRLYLTIGSILLLTACQSNEKPQTKMTEDSIIVSSNIEEEVLPENNKEEDDKTKPISLDTIKNVVNDWNQALVEQDYEKLNTLYDQSVLFYTSKMTKQVLIKSKKDWLAKHLDYQQDVIGISVRYPENSKLIECVFNKKYSTQKKEDSVKAILVLKKVGKEYLIVQETDQLSELKKIKKATPINLPKGNYSFTHSYWEDTRQHAVLGHDFARNDMNVDLVVDDNISVSFSTYSGFTRRYLDYVVKEVTHNEGIVSFKAAAIYQEDDLELGRIKEEDYSYLKFKILGNNEIALVEEERWDRENLGCRFWSTNISTLNEGKN